MRQSEENQAQAVPVHVHGNDYSINQMVSSVLKLGLILSLALMLIGLVLSFVHPDQLSAQAVPIGELGSAVLAGSPMGFYSLGIMILLATPAVRVLVLVLEYLYRREWPFAVVSIAVLAVLVLSVALRLKE